MNRKDKRRETEQRRQEAVQRLPPGKRVFGLQALIVFIFSLALYANTITHDYAVDDTIVITKNTLTVKGFKGIPQIMTTDAFYGFFGEGYKLVEGGRYRPLSIVTFAIENQLFGDVITDAQGNPMLDADGDKTYRGNPHISHLINIVLFALMGVLIFFLIAELLQTKTPSSFTLNVPFIAALLFVAHPIHTEAVANIKGRDEIMGMLGALLTLYCAVLYVKREKVVFLPLALVAWVFALLSKENAITYLAVVPLTFYFFTNAGVKKHLIVTVPLLVIAAVYVVMRQKFTGLELGKTSPEILNNPFVFATTGERLATVSFTFWEYIRLLFVPHPLTHDYYFNQVPIINWSSPKAILPLLLTVALIAYAIRGIRSKNVFSYAILYHFITLSIVSNILFTVGIAMNERFLFLSSLGFCLIIALLLVKATNYFKEKDFSYEEALNPVPLGVVLALILAGYSAKTYSRNLDWKDDFTLFKKDAQNSPNSAKIHNALGGEYLTQADKQTDPKVKKEYIKNAEKVLARALQIYPDYMNALLLMGNAKYKINDSLPEAMYYYKRTLQMKPEYFEGNFNLGCILLEKNKAAESILYFRKAVKIKPQKFESSYNLAEAYFKTNQPDSAVYYYTRALPMLGADPKRQALCHYKIALSYAKKKYLEQTVNHVQKAHELDPTKFSNEEMDDPDFAITVYTTLLERTTDNKLKALYYYKIGLCYGKQKNDLNNAIANISKAAELDPQNLNIFEDLGVAYGFKQDYMNAIMAFEKALAINPNYAKVYYNLGITYKQIGQETKANEYFAKQKQLEAGGM